MSSRNSGGGGFGCFLIIGGIFTAVMLVQAFFRWLGTLEWWQLGGQILGAVLVVALLVKAAVWLRGDVCPNCGRDPGLYPICRSCGRKVRDRVNGPVR